MTLSNRLFRYLTKDQLKGLGIFWLIITLVNILASIASYTISVNVMYGPMLMVDGFVSFAGSNLFAVIIYFIVYSLMMYHENFSLAVGFGATRKNTYLHIILNNIIVVLISAVVQIILLKIDNIIVARMGSQPITDFGLFNMNDNMLLNILVLAFIFMVFTSLTNLLATLQYRFGAKFWIVFGLFVFVMQIFTAFLGVIFRGLGELAVIIFEGRFLIGVIVILVAYSLGFAVIRRVNIR